MFDSNIDEKYTDKLIKTIVNNGKTYQQFGYLNGSRFNLGTKTILNSRKTSEDLELLFWQAATENKERVYDHYFSIRVDNWRYSLRFVSELDSPNQFSEWEGDFILEKAPFHLTSYTENDSSKYPRYKNYDQLLVEQIKKSGEEVLGPIIQGHTFDKVMRQAMNITNANQTLLRLNYKARNFQRLGYLSLLKPVVNGELYEIGSYINSWAIPSEDILFSNITIESDIDSRLIYCIRMVEDFDSDIFSADNSTKYTIELLELVKEKGKKTIDDIGEEELILDVENDPVTYGLYVKARFENVQPNSSTRDDSFSISLDNKTYEFCLKVKDSSPIVSCRIN